MSILCGKPFSNNKICDTQTYVWVGRDISVCAYTVTSAEAGVYVTSVARVSGTGTCHGYHQTSTTNLSTESRIRSPTKLLSRFRSIILFTNFHACAHLANVMYIYYPQLQHQMMSPILAGHTTCGMVAPGSISIAEMFGKYKRLLFSTPFIPVSPPKLNTNVVVVQDTVSMTLLEIVRSRTATRDAA